MRATQVVERGQVEFVEVAAPTLKPGHVLIRPMLVALCGSDVHRVYYADANEYPFIAGTSGHEMIGMVEAVDAPGYAIEPRDLALTISPAENVMSELYLAAAEDVLVLPKGRPLDHLLMAQQLGTTIYTAKRLPNLVGKEVAVIGQGSAGLFLNYMCRRLGARTIIGIDNIEARVAAGPRFGATHMINNAKQEPLRTLSEITGGHLADVVIEAAGEVATINLAPKLAKTGGHLHYFGIPRTRSFPFDFDVMFRKYLHTTSLSGTAHEPGRHSFRQALNIIAGGEIDVAPMLTHRLPFERAREGYEMAYTRSNGAIKIVIEMSGYHTYVNEEHQQGKRNQRA
jgi:L-iditol 2-dehydrogenase